MLFKRKSSQIISFIILTLFCAGSFAINDKGSELINVADKKEGTEIVVKFDEPLKAAPKSFVMHSPNQIIFDFFNVQKPLPNMTKKVNKGGIKEIALSSSSDRVRLVIKGDGTFKHDVNVADNKATILLHKEVKVLEGSLLNDIGVTPLTNGENASVKLSFSKSELDVSFDKKDRQLDVLFKNITAPELIKKKINVATNQIVEGVDLKEQGANTLVTINTKKDFEYLSHQVEKDFMVTLRNVKNRSYKAKQVMFSPKKKEKITLNFQKIAIRSVLQLLAEFAGMNVVISDTVQGDISLKLDNVPWEKALDVILKTKDLAKRKIGNVLLIAPTSEIVAQETRDLKSQKQAEELTALRSEIIQVNYADAKEIATLLTDKEVSILSARGSVTTDSRTNVVLVKDTEENLYDIKRLVRRLDIPVQQILIETRIVDVNKDFERELGINFGLSAPKENLTGSFGGASELAKGTTIASLTDPRSRLNLNLPSAFGTTAGSGGVGLALAKLGSNVLLDLELKALESEDRGTIISTPHVVTMDRHTAKIESGEEIPYREATSSGAASIAFRKAVLKLEVTPNITPNKKIILNLTVNNDEAGKDVGAGLAIKTKVISTQILVNNGETIVLGGVLKTTEKDVVKRLPFLGNLPVLGHLFSNKHKKSFHSELLVFITPKIIDSSINQSRLDKYDEMKGK